MGVECILLWLLLLGIPDYFPHYPTPCCEVSGREYVHMGCCCSSHGGLHQLWWSSHSAVLPRCSRSHHHPSILVHYKFLVSCHRVRKRRGNHLLTSSHRYTRDEIPTRTGLWFAGNSVGGLVASFLAYGVGHIEDSLAPWVWMYIILGSLTFVWGIPMLLFLPDSISTAKFLTPEEREVAA